MTGDWNLKVQERHIVDFTANITMSHTGMAGSHIIKLLNFEANDTRTGYLGPDGTTLVMGKVDIELDGTEKCKEVCITIFVEKYNTIHIVLDSPTIACLFKGQPIYGVLDCLYSNFISVCRM